MKEIDVEVNMDEGYNCAQSLLLPFLNHYGIGKVDGIKMASAFGTGLARMQETCGAVSGALIVLGLEYGSENPKNLLQKNLLLEKSKKFIFLFEDQYGTVKCRELLKCDLNTDDGLKKHKRENQRELICKLCVKYSARTLDKIIHE